MRFAIAAERTRKAHKQREYRTRKSQSRIDTAREDHEDRTAPPVSGVQWIQVKSPPEVPPRDLTAEPHLALMDAPVHHSAGGALLVPNLRKRCDANAKALATATGAMRFSERREGCEGFHYVLNSERLPQHDSSQFVGADAKRFFRNYKYGDAGKKAGYPELAPNMGALLSMCDGPQSHITAEYMIGSAEHSIYLSAFTFDHPKIVHALVSAVRRGVAGVTVYVDRDHTLSGTTVGMIDALNVLQKGGVSVFTTTAPTSHGCQHSKTLLCDQALLLGSANWTRSSSRNLELNALVWMNGAGLVQYTHALVEHMRLHGRMFTAEDSAQGTISRRAHARGRSVEARSSNAAPGFAISHDIRAQRRLPL